MSEGYYARDRRKDKICTPGKLHKKKHQREKDKDNVANHSINIHEGTLKQEVDQHCI